MNKTYKKFNLKKKMKKIKKSKYKNNSVTKKKYKIANILNRRLNRTIKQNIITIGILSAPYISNSDSFITSYIASSYVKWLESAGALVVPLAYDLPKPILNGFLKQLNGILLIGGGIDNKSTHSTEQFIFFEETIRYILNFITYENKIGNYYPIWATCMSFELIGILSINNNHILKYQNNINKYLIKDGFYGSDSLKWTNSPSKIKRLFTKKEINDMEKYYSVFYAHSLSFALNSEIGREIKKVANIVATGISQRRKIKYIAMYEHKNLPIYGVQFHPEKPAFEYENDGYRVPKSQIAITLSSKLANFFLNECKKNHNIWIGGKKFYDFTINDYNIFNKSITNRIKNFHKSNISTFQIGDAGVYFFGSKIIPSYSDILSNPWKAVKDNTYDSNKKIIEEDNP